MVCFNSFAAIVTTNTDKILTINSSCLSAESPKKTIILVDQTVDNKDALITALKSLESKISNYYGGENKEYLLNHKFEFSRIDDSGEHSSEWTVQTSKVFGNHSKKLQEGLVEFNLNLEKSIAKIKDDKKYYQSSMLLEQITSYSKGLDKCDNLIVISDLLLVDKEGNNFEKGIFTSPASLGVKIGRVYLLRIAKDGQRLKDIKKVEAWWDQSLNGGMSFSSVYPIKNVPSFKEKHHAERRLVSSIVNAENADSLDEDQVGDSQSSVQTTEVGKAVPKASTGESVDLNFDSFPTQESDSLVLPKAESLVLKEDKKESHSAINSEEEGEDEEEFYDDFSDLGIDVNHLFKDDEKKTAKKEIVEPSPLPAKKEVDIKFIQLACDEFTGRLTREAFPLCNIDQEEIKNSKIELTLGQDGRINTYENTLNISLNKKTCLSGYVASKPAVNVGADFTCRVLMQ
jgi:hypothetical protein